MGGAHTYGTQSGCFWWGRQAGRRGRDPEEAAAECPTSDDAVAPLQEQLRISDETAVGLMLAENADLKSGQAEPWAPIVEVLEQTPGDVRPPAASAWA
jgi:hypothetical protein